MDVSADEVLAFWFDESGPEQWFEQDDGFDETIRARFGEACHAARDGKLESWVETPRGCLALIILIDQFSRNIHRDSPLAWSADVHALALTKLAIEKGFDRQLDHAQRQFLYMPLMHSEMPDDQALSVELFRRLAEEGAENGQVAAEFAERHKEIIDRFGRYPHRNHILGRDSTPEEIAFLEEPNSSF